MPTYHARLAIKSDLAAIDDILNDPTALIYTYSWHEIGERKLKT
jgi:hypothetical protein